MICLTSVRGLTKALKLDLPMKITQNWRIQKDHVQHYCCLVLPWFGGLNWDTLEQKKWSKTWPLCWYSPKTCLDGAVLHGLILSVSIHFSIILYFHTTSSSTSLLKTQRSSKRTGCFALHLSFMKVQIEDNILLQKKKRVSCPTNWCI